VVNSSHQQRHEPKGRGKQGEFGNPTITEERLKPRAESWSWRTITDEAQMNARRRA
jgi:hypothetical protein